MENEKLEDGRRGKREKGERAICQDVKMWIRCPVMRRRVNIMATYAMDTSEKKNEYAGNVRSKQFGLWMGFSRCPQVQYCPWAWQV